MILRLDYGYYLRENETKLLIDSQLKEVKKKYIIFIIFLGLIIFRTQYLGSPNCGFFLRQENLKCSV